MNRSRPSRSAALREALSARYSSACGGSHPRAPSRSETINQSRELRGLWKFRVRRFRIVYATDRARHTIRLMAVDPRQSIYEDLRLDCGKPSNNGNLAACGGNLDYSAYLILLASLDHSVHK